jgi:GT2 family glycosyltransferase/glycosyltransferase involved in cell wall biosynthesis
MSFNWKIYCYQNGLPSSSTKEDAYNHYLKHNKPTYNKNTEPSDTSVVNQSWTHEIFPEVLSDNKNLLFLCHTIPTPDMDSGSNRIVELLKILIGLGYKIYYLTHDLQPDNLRYLEDLYKLGVTRVLGADHKNEKYCHNYIEELTVKEHIIFNVIFFEFYEMYCAYWEKIKYLIPNVKTIIDTVDVHWVRKLSNPSNTEFDIEKILIEKNQEKEAYSKANVVFAVTEEDKSEIVKECPLANVKILSNIHTIHGDIDLNLKNKDLIFVGGDNHTPNTIAAQNAINIFIDFLNKYPEFSDNKLHVVGKRTDKKILSYSNHQNIIIHNKLPQIELDNLYKKSWGALCPITWGAGIKGKICEAISKGLVVITTPVGASGLNLISEIDAIVHENITKQDLYKLFKMNNDLYIQMVSNARIKLNRIAGIESATKVLEGTLILKPIVLSIVTHNNAYLLQRCIESILSKTRYSNYRIHVTSNACKDETPKIMKFYTEKYKHISYQYNSENKHFIQAHNEAIELFKDSDIVLLNEDIEILSSCWLSDLYSAVYSAGYIGCAGGKTIYPNGTICEAGAQLYNTGSGENIGRHKHPDEEQFNIMKYVGYVSGCMMYMRRDCIDKFGAMDMRYYPCYYEDSDWQYNLHINGYKTIYTPKVIAIHREGSSCGTDIDDTKSFKKFMNVNKTKFVDKYINYNIEQYNQ